MDKIDVDINALYSLKGAIGSASKYLVNIAQAIRTHLSNTLERLQKTIDYIQTKLDEAQRVLDKAKDDLYEAESAYNSCLRSQKRVEDEDGHVYYEPSCSFEKGRVSLCREIVHQAEKVRDMWQEKLDEAEEIKNDCEREINRYNDHGGFFHNPGGDGILTYLAEDHSSKATAGLEDTINAVQDILSYSFETGESSYTPVPDVMYEMHNTQYTEEIYDNKREQFEEGKRRVEERIDKLNKERSSIFEICPHCHKFRHVGGGCDCERGQHERER